MTTSVAPQETPTTTDCQENPCPCRTRQYRPRFDVVETADELVLYGDFPGVGPDDVDIQFENRELSISGSVRAASERADYLHHEYPVGDFHRSFALAESIDATKTSAELKNGVLTIHLPKKEEVKPQRIQVTT